MIRRVLRLFKNLPHLKSYWINGGITRVNVSQINYGGILSGKRVLITGGGSGIGFAIAKKCLSEGATVLITGRNKAKLEEVKQRINNPKFKVLEWDISNISEIQDKLQLTYGMLGGIDCLINNAGVHSTKGFLNVSEEEWDRVYQTNSKGLFFLSQALCKKWSLLPNEVNKIINISSTSGFVATTSPYGLSKWDVVGLTQGLALSFASKNIIVNGIAPGRTATQMLGFMNEVNMYNESTPVKRYALPVEIAELAVFLLCSASNYLTGQTIICDGGRSLQD